MDNINIDLVKLKELITKYTVRVSFNGFEPYKHDVVNAKKLFEDLHEIANCDKETFVTYVNDVNKKTKSNNGNELIIKTLFGNIKHQVHFKTLGYDALAGDPYIELEKLKSLI